VAADFDVTLVLYTTAEDLVAIEADVHFAAFRRQAAVKYVCIDSFAAAHPRNHWAFWQHAVAAFRSEFHAFVLLIPDCLYANDSLTRIVAALDSHAIVYYTVPQICRELVVGELEEMASRGSDGVRTLNIPRPRLLELLLKYINPKHAVALHHPTMFVTHPEYLLQVEPRRLGIIELAAHPLALRSPPASVTQAFNPASSRQDAAFLEILALGCEFTLKFIEQYYRWPALSAHASRYASLASWCFTFREHGALAFAETQAEIALGAATAPSDRRSPVRGHRLRYANVAMRLMAGQYRLYEFASATSSPEARRCIALAMCLPGLRRRIAALGEAVTVLLPSSGNIGDMLGALQSMGPASAFREFCLMHVVPGHLRLRRGDGFMLWPSPSGSTADAPRLQLVAAAVPDPREATATGKVLSYPYLIDEGVIVYGVELDYGNAASLVGSLSR